MPCLVVPAPPGYGYVVSFVRDDGFSGHSVEDVIAFMIEYTDEKKKRSYDISPITPTIIKKSPESFEPGFRGHQRLNVWMALKHPDGKCETDGSFFEDVAEFIEEHRLLATKHKNPPRPKKQRKARAASPDLRVVAGAPKSAA